MEYPSPHDFIRTETNEDMRLLHNMYAGRACFIVATGPSLRMEDLDTLNENHIPCISMNGIFHAFDNTDWRPDIFVMSDAGLRYYEEQIEKLEARYKVISDNYPEYWERKHAENILKIHMQYTESGEVRFSDDLAQKGAYSSATVTYVCLQLAVWMGCKEIYLLGVDFSDNPEKSSAKTHFTDSYADELPNSQESIGVYKNHEITEAMGAGYRAARKYADSHGIHIYNATRGGYLEILDRVDMDSLFTGGKFTPEKAVIHKRPVQKD